SSQSVAVAPGRVYVANSAPLVSSAKKRALSPLSLCAQMTPGWCRLTASPEISVRSGDCTVPAMTSGALDAQIVAAADSSAAGTTVALSPGSPGASEGGG